MSDTSQQPATDAQPATDPSPPAAQTGTEFRDAALYAIAGLDAGQQTGMDVKQALEAYYGEAVNHGRLYPNLDRLADEEFIEKSAVNNRTNRYQLTTRGRDYLRAKLAWQAAQLGLRLVDESGTETADGQPDADEPRWSA